MVSDLTSICIAAEGKLSRMSLIDPDLDEGDLGIVVDDGPGSGLSSPDPDNDLLDRQLRLANLDINLCVLRSKERLGGVVI